MGEVIGGWQSTHFFIPADRLPMAHRALQAQPSSPLFELGTTEQVAEAASFAELMGLTCFACSFDGHGNLRELSYRSDKLPRDCDLADLERFFSTIAPCVRPGAVMRFREGGYSHTLRFEGGACSLASRKASCKKPQSPEKRARELRQRGDVDGAIAVLDAAIEASSGAERVALVESKALSLESENRWAGAAATYAHLAELAPEHEYAHHRRGLTLEAIDRLAEAEAAFQCAAPHSLFQFLARRGRWEEALRVGEANLESADFAGDPWWRLDLHRYLGRYAALPELAEWAVDVQRSRLPDHAPGRPWAEARFRLHQAEAYYELDRAADGLAVLAEVTDWSQEPAIERYYNHYSRLRSRLLVTVGDAEEAKSEAGRLVQRLASPTDGWRLRELAEALLVLGRHDDAIDCADRSADMGAPARALFVLEYAFDALQVAAAALLALGRPEEALERIERAIVLNAHPPQPWYLRACASAMLGEDGKQLEESLAGAAAKSPRLAREIAAEPRWRAFVITLFRS